MRDPPRSRHPRLVTVIVPVRNGEQHLAEQLEALAAQTYRGEWELLVVDNGSRDGSPLVAQGFASRLSLRVIDASSRRGLNRARNAGAAAARGEFLAFCDADDVVAPGWLEALVRAGAEADLVAGAVDFFRLNEPLYRAWRPDRLLDTLPVAHGFLPYAPGGNCGMWAHVAREIGWDDRFRFGSSDIEFSWRAQLAAYRIAHASDAIVHQRYRRSLLGLARQFYAYGRSGPQLYRCFRRQGMPAPDPEATRGRWRWIVRHAPDLVRTPERRGNWIRMASFSLGQVSGSLRWRVPFL